METYYSFFAKKQISFLCIALFTSLCFGYFYVPPGLKEGFLPLLLVETLQFPFMLFLFWGCFANWREDSNWHLGKGKNLFLFLISAAVVSRVILWFTTPIMEDDFWRYMWDGHVFTNGINPFIHAPVSSALDHLQTDYRGEIGYRGFRTIYPPFAQYVFAIAAFLFPHSLIGLKAVLTLFDLGTALVLWKWLRFEKLNPAWTLLYLLNPLVLKEIANSAHLDSIVVFLTVLSVYLFRRQRYSLSWAALAVGVCAKLFPVLLIPFYMKLDRRWFRHLALFVGIVALMYLPFISAGSLLFSGTKAFAKYWIFNASIFKLIDLVVREFAVPYSSIPWVASWLRFDYFTKIIIAPIFAMVFWTLWRRLKAEQDLANTVMWLFGWVLLLSPVANTWYVLWVLPFAALVGNIGWLSFSYLVLASYSWFYSKDAATYFRSIEYLILYTLLFWPWIKRKAIAKKSP